MKSKLIVVSQLLLASFSSHAQGWVSNSSQMQTGSMEAIYPVNNLLDTEPIKIGIGTKSPTAQLHTNKGVRFEVLTSDNTLPFVLYLTN